MKNVLIPLTPLLVDDGDNTSAERGGFGEVLVACIHREDRPEAAVSIGPEPEISPSPRGNLASLRFYPPVLGLRPSRPPRIGEVRRGAGL